MKKSENNTKKGKSLGGRLSLFLEDQEIKRKDLAKKMDIPYDRLSTYIQDRAEPPSEFWTKLKKLYPEVDANEIITGIRTRFKYKVPVLNTVPAGDFMRSYDDLVAEDFIFTNINMDGLFALTVKGDSMSPRIESGDLVIAKADLPFTNGATYIIVAKDSEASLKMLFMEDDFIRCEPFNRAYPGSRIKKKDIVRLYKVLQVIKNLG